MVLICLFHRVQSAFQPFLHQVHDAVCPILDLFAFDKGEGEGNSVGCYFHGLVFPIQEPIGLEVVHKLFGGFPVAIKFGGRASLQASFAGFGSFFFFVVIWVISHRHHVYLGGWVYLDHQGKILEGFFIIHWLVSGGDCRDPLGD